MMTEYTLGGSLTKEARGQYNYKNGNVYEGEMFKGVMQGKGKYTWKNGNIYGGHLRG